MGNIIYRGDVQVTTGLIDIAIVILFVCLSLYFLIILGAANMVIPNLIIETPNP